MKGVRDSEPDGNAGDVFWALFYGGEMTVPQIDARIAGLYAETAEPDADWLPPTRRQVWRALQKLAERQPPLIAGGKPRPGHKARFYVTGHGQRMARLWDGESGREPCGLGWPA